MIKKRDTEPRKTVCDNQRKFHRFSWRNAAADLWMGRYYTLVSLFIGCECRGGGVEGREGRGGEGREGRVGGAAEKVYFLLLHNEWRKT